MSCKTGKRGFTTRAKARKKLLHGPFVAQRTSKAVYPCPFCGQWHLTSQSRRRQAA
jgi:ribosomal protein L32